VSNQNFVDFWLDLIDPNPEVFAFRREWTDENAEGQQVKRSCYINTNYEGTKETTRQQVAEVIRQVGTGHFNAESVLAHFKGELFIGVYPLHPDSTVKFFALDFDGKNGDPLEDAADAYHILSEEAGLPVYLERSQSGNGYHVWGFFEERINARTVRQAIKQFITKEGTFDRMFPNQNGVTELRPLGNLIAMPLFGPKVKQGNNCFGKVLSLDDGRLHFEPASDQKEFVRNIELIQKAAIEELAATAPELPEDRVIKGRVGAADGSSPGARKMTDHRFGCEWVRWCVDSPEEVTEPEWYALACQCAQLEGGRDLFHEISALSVRYEPGHTDAKFDHAVAQNAPHTCDYIRENLKGPKCECDRRFPGRVSHPYDLGQISVFELIKSVQTAAAVENAVEGFLSAIEWLEKVQADPTLGMGLPSGIPVVDEHVGFRRSTMNVLAARPSIGKTALAMDIAYRMAMSGVPVFFFSLEMSSQQLWLRLLGRAAGVDGMRMRKGKLTPEDWKRIKQAEAEIKAMPHFPLYVDDTTRDIRQIMEIAWDLQEKYGRGIVMIDYLGLLDWYNGENEYAATTRNSKESKLLAKALDCPVLLLHQFNRSGDDMGIDAETFDSWLRSSGQIEQDADVILYLLGDRGLGIKDRMLVKQKDRDGEAGHRIPLEFNQSVMQFGAQGTWMSLMAAARIAGADDDIGDTLSWDELE
jgi:KaiC/GvpD/RAD55 family RecA-like ATPase